KVIERWSMHFADRVITINEPITDLLVERGLNRAATTVIMNSADESVFHKNGKVAETKKTQGAFVMMYHGTLTQLYGLDIAIEAFAMAAKDMPGAEFWILGSGPEAKPLRELAEQRGLSQKV